MRRLLIPLFALAPLLATAHGAFAASPSFISGGIVDPPPSITIYSQEAGLGNTAPIGGITYIGTADVSVEYGCINGGSNHPKASNKAYVDASTTGSGSYFPQNGQISQDTLTLSPPPPPTGWDCPAGQTAYLLSVTYSNLVVTDTYYNDQLTLAGPYTYTGQWAIN